MAGPGAASRPEFGKPVIVVIAGPNGAGKTTVTRELLRHRWTRGAEYINPDDIALKCYGGWNTTAFLKAAVTAERMRNGFLGEERSFLFETVLSTSEKIDFLSRAKDAGFFVRLFFIGTDAPSINIARVRQRVSQGGHPVPAHKIVDRYGRSLANCLRAIAVVDRAYLFDNSIDLAGPKLLFRTENGRLASFRESKAWAAPILDVVPAMPADDPSG